MSLSDLPDDILGLISFKLNGFDNCSLWMASDSKLRQRLVINVITEFNIEYTIPGRYVWPGNFLKKLQRLSRLSLVVDKAVYHIPIENVELFPIETLKYLKLECTNLYKIVKQSDDAATGPTTSSTNNYINLNNLFPNLDYFGFSHRYLSLDATITIDFLRYLPQNLKTLEILDTLLRVNKFNPEYDMNINIALLPRTLTALNLSVGAPHKDSFDASKLPPNLTSLITNARMEGESYAMMPKNLKVLQLSYREYDIPKMAPYLPTGLQILSINSRSMISESLSHLQNLECIEAYGPSEHDQTVRRYPPTLKKFRGDYDGPKQFKISTFPHGLLELSFKIRKPLDHEFFVMLPQTVTHLSLYCRENTQKLEFLSLLPKNLRYLDTDLPITESILLLPKSLTYLRLTSDELCKISEIDRLPPKLETFINRGGIPVPQSLMKNLPQTLTCLDVWNMDTLIDDSVIRMLPRGLKTLLFYTQDEITDASAADFPPNMNKIWLVNNTHMTDDGVALLPRSLMFLDLPKNRNLTDKCIKHLPRNLIEFHLEGATQISSQSCKDLPKYLKSLRLPRCKQWEMDALPDMPPHLIFIDTGNTMIKDAWMNRHYNN